MQKWLGDTSSLIQPTFAFFLLGGLDWRLFGYPIADAALDASDPLAPPPSERALWDRIDAFAPDTAVVLKPDHVRDVDLFVRWYGARAYGPQMFWRDDIPSTELEPVRAALQLLVRS